MAELTRVMDQAMHAMADREGKYLTFSLFHRTVKSGCKIEDRQLSTEKVLKPVTPL